VRWSEESDYAIIGAGSAGCVLAARLSEDTSASVQLLEAGGSDRDPRIRAPGAQGFLIKSRHDWGFWTEPQEHAGGRRFYLPRGKTLGGSGSINTSIYIRGHARDYDEWAELGSPGWAWRDCLPLFKRSEHNTRGADELHGADGPLWVSDLDEPNPLTERFVGAAESAGLGRNPDFNGPRQQGAGVYQVTHRNGRRWSPADAFLRPALTRPNLRATTHALVHRVVFEGRRAVGVIYSVHGRSHALRARREVILCGGAIGSPHLLLRSGIGPAAQLRALGIDVVADLPGVGNNLQDHVHAPVIMESDPGLGMIMPKTPRQWLTLAGDVVRYLARRRGQLASNLAEGGGFVEIDAPDGRPDVQLHFAPGYAAPPPEYAERGRWAYTLLGCVLRPRSRGEVRLRSADPRDPPIIDPRFLSERADVDTIVRGLELVRDLAHSSRFGTTRRELIPGRGADLEKHARNHSFSVHHAAGTCRMGSDDGAVLDPQLRVRGVDGLRVVDCSVMPRVVGGNTNAPTIMIAERGADFVRSGR
jgi:choline dehydrogenase-like flavoprotein